MPPAATPPWSRRTATVVAAAFFLEQFDGTVLFAAVPSIARDFGVASTSVTIATTAYLVAAATFIPLGGWLAARLGGRRVFLAALAIFCLASIGCAASPDLIALTLFRIAQGFGGALMVPIGRLIVLRSTSPTDLLRATAYFTWPALVAPVLAPALGGLAASTIGWRWIFLLSVPFGAAVLVAAFCLIGDVPLTRRPLDRRGLALAMATTFGLIFGLEFAATGGGLASAALILGSAGIGLLAVRHLLRAEHPLLDLRVFRLQTFRATNLGGAAYRAAVMGVPFLIPLLLQDGLALDAATSGLVLAALFAGNAGIKPATTPLLRAVPFRTVLIAAAACAAAFGIGFAFVGSWTPISLLCAALLVSGACRSVGFTAYATIQFAEVGAAELASANSLSAMVQQLSNAFAIAIAATAVHAAASLVPIGHDPLLPYRVAFLIAAAFGVVALIHAARLPREAGDALRRR